MWKKPKKWEYLLLPVWCCNFSIKLFVKLIQGTCCETEHTSNTQIPFLHNFLIKDFIKKKKKQRIDLRTYFEKSSYHHSYNSNYFHEESCFRSHQMFLVNTGTQEFLWHISTGFWKRGWVKRLPKGLHGGSVPCSRHNSWWQRK